MPVDLAQVDAQDFADTASRDKQATFRFGSPFSELAGSMQRQRFLQTAGGVFLGLITAEDVEERLLRSGIATLYDREKLSEQPALDG